MIVLGIETSVRQGSVALCDDDRLLAESSLQQSRQRHAQTLVQTVDELFRAQHVKPQDCGLVAVSCGPGSFTGLRVGVVFAKTLAFATGCRLVAVETLMCCARRAPDRVEHIWVIADAQRGDLYVNAYQRQATRWHSRGSVQIVPGESWCRQRSVGDVVTGPAAERYRDRLSGCEILPQTLHGPTAREVAAIGWELHQAGQHDDPFELVPRYLRRSSAEEKYEERMAADSADH